MSNLARLTDVNVPSAKVPDALLFLHGRLGMGWSAAALAETLLVDQETVLAWEAGSRPIPPKVLCWVAMYVRNGPADGVETDATANDDVDQIALAA